VAEASDGWQRQVVGGRVKWWMVSQVVGAGGKCQRLMVGGKCEWWAWVAKFMVWRHVGGS